jgi:hypothetical protein
MTAFENIAPGLSMPNSSRTVLDSVYENDIEYIHPVLID